MRIARISGLFAFSTAAVLIAQDLQVQVAGDQLKVLAPRLHFITGKPLEQMRNGNAVAYDFQLTVSDESRNVLRRAFERFVVSYDLWQEKFSVARMRSVRAQTSDLNAEAAEAWCVDNVAVLASGLPQNGRLIARLEIKLAETRRPRADEEEEGLSLSALVELFSRGARRSDDQRWRAESTPFRLDNIRRSSPGLRGGL